MSAATRPPPCRWDFVDWLRGLAVLLMFQTHLYDSFVRPDGRAGEAWYVTRHLGGFPARMFLFLAGVALVLRLDRDRRRGVSDGAAAWAAATRGLEVLGIGLAFRVTEWALGGAALERASDMLRVDILNTIGVSLAAAALVCGTRPRHMPWIAGAATLVIVLGTPFVEVSALWELEPRFLFAYLTGPKPMAFFPFFPWAAYTFAGVLVGAIFVRAAERGRLGHAVLAAAAAGVALAVAGQLLRDPRVALYSFGDNATRVTGPNAFVYRSGVVLASLGLAWLYVRGRPAGSFSPLRLLGQTSLLTYWVHVELVYGHAFKPLHGQLGFAWATAALVLLTAAMLALAWWRVHRWPALFDRLRASLRTPSYRIRGR